MWFLRHYFSPLLSSYELTSPFRKQYMSAIKKPWNEVRKWVPYDQTAKFVAVFRGASWCSRLVIPKSGSRTIAALTAFRVCSISLAWDWRNFITSTRIIFTRKQKFSCRKIVFLKISHYKIWKELTSITASRGPSRIQ